MSGAQKWYQAKTIRGMAMTLRLSEADDRMLTDRAEGSAGLLRLRIGRSPLLYEVADTVIRIDVIHAGRAG